MVAFTGAYGWGAQSVGGRGGTVIEVTNTNDSGAGSLRAAIDETYPRIIVFRTGGLITLSSDLRIDDPYLTIAGQTAPGGGIHINGKRLLIKTHNIIIRYLRWRGSANSFLAMQPGAAGQDVHDIIIDHCSMSWGLNDALEIWKEANATISEIYNITIQNCLIAEPHKDHATAIQIGAEDGSYDAINELHHISVHHNLFVHCGWRNPARITAKHSEIINNVVYNWGDRIGGTNRTAEVDWINNYFLDGPMSDTDAQSLLLHTTDGTASLYINGNIGPNIGYPTDSVDNWGMWVDSTDKTPISLDHRRYNRLAPSPTGIPTQYTNDAYNSVLADVGANARLNSNGDWVANIDSTDTRLLADVAAGTGPTHRNNITVPGTIGTIAAGTAYTDTDSDGMPDDWESLHGLDPNDDTDGPLDAGNGYSNVEMFLNGKDYMSNIHIYLGIENIDLNTSQKQTLVTELKALGPASDPQPARLNHWRTRTDGEAVILEALFNENNLTVARFKQRLGAIFGIGPATINHSTIQRDFAGFGTPVVTFSRDGTDYLRFALFGGLGAAWMESGDECRGYLKANQDEW